MILARTALVTVKSLLSSAKPPFSCMLIVLQTPVRTISIGLDHLKLVNVGDRLRGTGSERHPDHTGFLGKFKEKSSQNEREFDMALGMTKKESKQLSKRKTWISYSIDFDKVWTYKVGFKGSDEGSEFHFKSGEEFTVAHNLVPVKYIIRVKGDVMTEMQTNVLVPEKVINIVRKVDGNKLTVVSLFGDVVMTKVYKRIEDDKTKYFTTKQYR